MRLRVACMETTELSARFVWPFETAASACDVLRERRAHDADAHAG